MHLVPGAACAAAVPRVLDNAEDASFLRELTLGDNLLTDDGVVEIYPPGHINTLRPALRDLINDGLVLLCDVTDGDSALTIEESLKVIDQDMNWSPREDGVVYGLMTTPAGHKAIQNEDEARRQAS